MGKQVSRLFTALSYRHRNDTNVFRILVKVLDTSYLIGFYKNLIPAYFKSTALV